MRMLKTMLILLGIFILAITSPVNAHGEGHGGGGHGGGGHFGGGGHISGYHGYSHGGYYRGGPRVAPYRGHYGGWGYGGPWLHWRWPWPYSNLYYYWGWPYYDPYYWGWPYPDYSYYSEAVPPAYSESEEQQSYYWYFCQDPQGYYPYIKDCPGGWMRVVPSKTNAPPPLLGAPVPPISPPGKDPSGAQLQLPAKLLTNDGIVSLVRGGLSDAIIVSVIQKSSTQFDLRPEALIKLKEAGISNAVIEAMIRGGGSLPGESTQQPPPTQGTVNMLLVAIATNNYDAFVANAAPGLKTRITKEEFKRVNTQLSPRLKQGYQLQYLGSLKQQGVEVFMWKIIYQDAGNDMVARLVLQGNKVAGFWIQ
jgi:hypothetical protein